MKHGLNLIAADGIEQALSLGCDSYVVSHYIARYLPVIRQRYPDAFILLRYITKDFIGTDPDAFAHNFALEALLWQPYVNAVCPWWEANNPIESLYSNTNNLNEIIRWTMLTAGRIKNLAPNLSLWLPPFSQGYIPIDFYYSVSAYREWQEIFDGVCVNAYGRSVDIITYCERVEAMLPPGTQFALTECNYGAGRDVREVYGGDLYTATRAYATDILRVFDWVNAQENWQAACVFAWYWPTPDTQLKTTVNVWGEPIEEAVRNYRGGIMKLSEQYPQIYQEWVKAGGIEDHFRDHLLGIGVLPPTVADAEHLLDQIGAKLAEARNVIAKLPK